MIIKLKLELADTPELLARGLMFRKELSNDSGMLFKFSNSLTPYFWGKNTYIPLDLAFIDMNLRIADIKNISPLSTKMVSTAAPCKYALETNAGFFNQHNIQVGQRISFITDEHGREMEINF